MHFQLLFPISVSWIYSFLLWLRNTKVRGKAVRLCCIVLIWSRLTSAGVIKKKTTDCHSALFDVPPFSPLLKTAQKLKTNYIKHSAVEHMLIPRNLRLHYLFPCTFPSFSKDPASLSLWQVMSLATLSGWISLEKATIKVITTPGGSLTWWIQMNYATLNSTPLTETWTSRRTSMAGCLHRL